MNFMFATIFLFLFYDFRHPNVLILTTSNVTEAIDLAFVDRADIKQYIGPPSPSAIYKIYHSCVNELMRVSQSCLLVFVQGIKSLSQDKY